MQGAAPSDEHLATIFELAVVQGRPKAQVGRIVGLTRQTVSGYCNREKPTAAAAHERIASAGRLAAALRRFGVSSAPSASQQPPPDLAEDGFPAFDPDVEAPDEITVDLLRDVSCQVAEGLPVEDVLVSHGVPRGAARDWLDHAEQAYEAGHTGWPASGWALLDRAQTHAGLRLRRQALADPSASPRLIALGRLVAPGMFAETQTAAGGPDPFDEIGDDELEALAYGHDPDEP